MNARIAVVVVCAANLLLAGSATAAGLLAKAGNGPHPHQRLAHFEFPRQDQASSLTQRMHGKIRDQNSNQHGFAAAPLTNRPHAPAASGRSSNVVVSVAAFEAPSTAAQFHFKRAGADVGREFERDYRNMCDRLSGHIWDEPNGRRVSFDSNGKPGIAIEIPIR